MAAARGLLLLAVLAAPVGTGRANSTTAGGLRPDRYCLSCLCTAATDCDVSTGCLNDEEGAVCGPFYMSEPYWKDADLTLSPRFSGHGFRQCAEDVECAGEAVSSYMQHFSRDCDGDGRVTCRDFGLLHFLGYSACSSRRRVSAGQRSGFYRQLASCTDRLAGLLAREGYTAPAGHAPLL